MRESTNHFFRALQKDKEDLEEVSTELELVDEEDKVPYVSLFSLRPANSLERDAFC